MSPAPKRPAQVVTLAARGFTPGKPVYVHFGFRGRTQRTVRLGVASGPRGIVSERMRNADDGVRRAAGDVHGSVDAVERGRPAWKTSFPIYR